MLDALTWFVMQGLCLPIILPCNLSIKLFSFLFSLSLSSLLLGIHPFLKAPTASCQQSWPEVLVCLLVDSTHGGRIISGFTRPVVYALPTALNPVHSPAQAPTHPHNGRVWVFIHGCLWCQGIKPSVGSDQGCRGCALGVVSRAFRELLQALATNSHNTEWLPLALLWKTRFLQWPLGITTTDI